MKKNFNVIQIKGIRGLILVAGFICCLIAGFVYFPGYVLTHVWNFSSKYVAQVPNIGIVQGILLWGIIAASYFLFRKEKLVVCMHSADEGLKEEELKQVFDCIRKQADNDILIKSMLRAREAELKIKNLNEVSIPKVKPEENDSQKIESK